MIRKILLGFIGIVCIIICYFLFWPVPFDPAVLQLQEMPSLTGVYAPNNQLSKVKLVEAGLGPEDVAFDARGRIYTGLEDGRIIRITSDGKSEDFCNTGGRPLGLEFDSEQNLIVADAKKGLLSVNTEGIITVLCSDIGGVLINFADDLDIAKDGTIYFSDASVKYPIDDYILDMWEMRPNGRLIAYYPGMKKTVVLLEDLYFANGVAISPDQTYVLVNETWTSRIRRYYIGGPKKGQADFFIENLPGYPDNLTSNGKDTFWVALIIGPDGRKGFDPLKSNIFMRKIIYRISNLSGGMPNPCGYVLGIGLDGSITDNLQDPTGEKYAFITSATEHKGKLYLGSLMENAIGSVDLAREPGEKDL